tara:strand:- start:99 stop:218 length:120 start_codon:yes stop_codon:yes gene_type:complete
VDDEDAEEDDDDEEEEHEGEDKESRGLFSRLFCGGDSCM